MRYTVWWGCKLLEIPREVKPVVRLQNHASSFWRRCRGIVIVYVKIFILLGLLVRFLSSEIFILLSPEAPSSSGGLGGRDLLLALSLLDASFFHSVRGLVIV